MKEEWLFPKSIEEAIAAQHEMAAAVVLSDSCVEPHWIAGMDVSNNLYDPAQMIYAAVALLSFPKLELIEQSTFAEKQEFAYVPGLLGFREAPALIHAFERLKQKPDLIMIDGHGISHPRGLGIASHIGVLLDIPTIGVAKSILVGRPASPLGEVAGSQVPLVWKGEEIAILLRSKARSNPLIISAGHKVTLSTAVELVKHSLRKYRLPEPTRQAHLLANSCRKSSLE